MSRLWGLASFLLINQLGVLSAHGGGGRWRVRIVVVLLGDPHLLLGGEGGQDDGLLLHTVSNTGYMVVTPDMTVLVKE